VLLTALAWRQRVNLETEAVRGAEWAVRARLARSELQLRLLTEQRLQLEVRLRIAVRAERERRARLRQLLRQLTYVEQREYERRGPRLFSGDGAVASSWHAVALDGTCPAEIPQWDWQLLLRAAEADDAVARADALAELHAQSRLALGELEALSQTYARVLANKEFEGILDSAHPPCGGRRFAWLQGERLLRIDCPHDAARYALDGRSELVPYRGPVRITDAETVHAFCGSEHNLLSHPLLQSALLPPPRSWCEQPQRPPPDHGVRPSASPRVAGTSS
jgi:hypothetical protein